MHDDGNGESGRERDLASGGAGGMRALVCAFGDPGHAFPAIGLARALAARGHRVEVETWERWRGAVEGVGLGFRAAEEYVVFPRADGRRDVMTTAADAAKALLPLMEEISPEVVVSDILTLAPTLAAEAVGVPLVTLVPHVYPVTEAGTPFFATGARLPRTGLGRAVWRAAGPLLESGLRQGRVELNEARAGVGLAPLERFHGGLSERLVLVGTFPQLEYPRRWPDHVRVTGPMPFELPHPDIELPAGEAPLVLVAPSTSQDPECRLVRGALEALADEDVRVVATTNGHHSELAIDVPGNAVLVDWVSYSQVLPGAALCICHGGHGTVARALAEGVPVLACPRAGDMAEVGVRIEWAGCGTSIPWRLARPALLRATVRAMLGDERFARAAGEIAEWARTHDGAAEGARLVEGAVP